MAMTVCINQPHYLPYLGYFKMIDECDVFVFYDDVQFEKQSWQCRNKIPQEDGFAYMQVPTKKTYTELNFQLPLGNLIQTNPKVFFAPPINQVEIRVPDFYLSQIDLLKSNYQKSPYLKELLEILEPIFKAQFNKLSELNITLIKVLANYIDLKIPVWYQSSAIKIKGGQTERLVNICARMGADSYLSPVGSKAYLEEGLFAENGIKLRYLNINPPDHWSIIHSLLTLGPQKTKEIIQNQLCINTD